MNEDEKLLDEIKLIRKTNEIRVEEEKKSFHIPYFVYWSIVKMASGKLMTLKSSQSLFRCITF